MNRPYNPELVLKTAEEDIETCAQQVIDLLKERGII